MAKAKESKAQQLVEQLDGALALLKPGSNLDPLSVGKCTNLAGRINSIRMDVVQWIDKANRDPEHTPLAPEQKDNG